MTCLKVIKMQLVISDFESTFTGYVHTISLIPIKIGQNGITQQKGVLLCIKDVIKNDIIKENPDVRKKIASSVIDVATYDLNIKYLNFIQSIEYMIDFVESHGGIIISHNLLGDLGFLTKTQDFVGGKRIIKKKLKEYPDTGMYDKRWENIVKICSISLISNRCTKFNEHYITFSKSHDCCLTPGGYFSTKLENYSQFVLENPSYKQSHSAVQDTIDLINILKSAINYDGKNIFDGTNYIVKPEWRKAVL
jgi:hypothetical protein